MHNETVIYYDFWNSVDDQFTRNSFVLLSEAEIADLRHTSKVYTFDDWIHPAGKVYGFTSHQIDRIENLDSSKIIYFISEGEEIQDMVRVYNENTILYKRIILQ
jgi:hypothetical protein